MRLRTSTIADVVDGTLVGSDVEVDGAGIDSRELRPGQLFVPVRGGRDGHDFIGDALSAGARAYLTARDPVGGAAVVVDDPAAALTTLGGHARTLLPERVVGITGSVGKTSAKDLAAAALGARWRVHASQRSFNNELGVPITLLGAADGTEAVVVEMGARGIGHIDELCRLARPTIGVVTAVELVHTELLGGLEGVARAKRELPASLPRSGTAVLNADNPHVAAMAHHTEADVLTFGRVEGDVRAERIELDHELRPRFVLHSPWGSAEVHVGLRGEHNVANALAAAAVALVCEVPLEGVADGLARAAGSPWRMELWRSPAGATVLNDAYNAGPASMAAALRALAALPAHRRVAVLGPMAELGEHEERSHAEIAALAGDLGIELLAVGTDAYGVPPLPDVDAAHERLGALAEGDAVLVKGSRVAGLEQLAHQLAGEV